MAAVPKSQSILQDKLSEAYDLFFKLFMAKFLRGSAIWWTPFVETKGKNKGRSLADWVNDDPYKAIEQLTRGRLRRLEALVLSKFESALIMWAIEKLDKDLEKHMSPALEYFFTLVFFHMGWPHDFLTAIHKSSLYFPPQLKKRADFPLQDIYKLKREYETLLAVVKDIKNKTRRNPGAQKCALLENLPGTSAAKVNDYQGMKASAIALDFLARKYKMPRGGEGLKKHFPKRIPQDVFDLELRPLRNLLKDKKPSQTEPRIYRAYMPSRLGGK